MPSKSCLCSITLYQVLTKASFVHWLWMAYFRIIAMLLFLEFLDQRYGSEGEEKWEGYLTTCQPELVLCPTQKRDAKASCHMCPGRRNWISVGSPNDHCKIKMNLQIKYIENYRTQTIQIYKISPMLQLILLAQTESPPTKDRNTFDRSFEFGCLFPVTIQTSH